MSKAAPAPSSPDPPSIKLPLWAVTVILFLISALVSSIMYVAETRSTAVRAIEELQDVNDRLKNVQEGVHQIWERLLDQEEGKR